MSRTLVSTTKGVDVKLEESRREIHILLIGSQRFCFWGRAWIDPESTPPSVSPGKEDETFLAADKFMRRDIVSIAIQSTSPIRRLRSLQHFWEGKLQMEEEVGNNLLSRMEEEEEKRNSLVG